MNITFHLENQFICYYPQNTNFEHNGETHEWSNTKARMLEQTYSDFKVCCRYHGDINYFISTHKELKRIDRNVLYRLRTKTNAEILNNIEAITEEVKKQNLFYSGICTDQNDDLACLVLVNKIMLDTPYCDILLVDDTVGVNSSDYPVINVVTVDANNHIQLIAFGYLPSKQTNGFILFFKILKELVENNTTKKFGDIFICDRCLAQRKATLEIFPSAKIIHCREHIRRNIYKNCNGTFYGAACNMLYNRTEEYENIYKEMLDELLKKTSSKYML